MFNKILNLIFADLGEASCIADVVAKGKVACIDLKSKVDTSAKVGIAVY